MFIPDYRVMEKSLTLDYVNWAKAVFIKVTNLISMLIKTFMTHILQFFILRLLLRSMAEGRSFSGPNIWLRPKVKIAPTVQHWLFYMSAENSMLFIENLMFFIKI